MVIEASLNPYHQRIENRRTFDKLELGQFFSESFFDSVYGTRRKVLLKVIGKSQYGLIVEDVHGDNVHKYEFDPDIILEIENIAGLDDPAYKAFETNRRSRLRKYNDYFCENFELISRQVIEFAKSSGKTYGKFEVIVRSENGTLEHHLGEPVSVLQREGDVLFEIRLHNGQIY